MNDNPHGQGALRRAGAGAAGARLALVMLHGRGAGADGILPLAAQLGLVDAALFAPEAAGRSWWPTSFLAPMERLQPSLDSALLAVARAIDAALEEGFEDDRIVLLGFSQGGCLALEYAARAGRRFRHVIGLSAGLVGTADSGELPSAALYGHAPKIFDYDAALNGVPVYIGCHEEDPHIPLARVRESEAVFRALGAACDVTIARGAGHGITAKDVVAMRSILLGAA